MGHCGEPKGHWDVSVLAPEAVRCLLQNIMKLAVVVVDVVD